MKLSHFTLFIIILLSCFVNSHAQKIRFTDSTNYWRTTSMTPEHPYSDQQYYFRGSNTIRGRRYQCMLSYYGSLCRYVREDTAAGLVYFISRDTTDTTEYILYNYNLNVGDTIRYIWPGSGGNTDSVINIDTVMIDGIAHRSFDLTNEGRGGNRGYTYIEGVGGTNSPFFHLEVTSCFEYGEILSCFWNNYVRPSFQFRRSYCGMGGSILYENCSDLAINAPSNYSQVSIFPNPVDDELTIAISGNGILQTDVKILNLDGQRMICKSVTNSKTPIQVDVSQLLEGVYILMVSDETGTIMRKPIVVGH